MNLALITPDHTELPEVVETTLKISGGADVLTTAFNKRGNLLAGGCSDGRVVVWDFDTYGIARELRGHAGPVTSVSWTRSSRRVLSSADDTLIVWEVLGGVELLRVRLDGPVHHAALHQHPLPLPSKVSGRIDSAATLRPRDRHTMVGSYVEIHAHEDTEGHGHYNSTDNG